MGTGESKTAKLGGKIGTISPSIPASSSPSGFLAVGESEAKDGVFGESPENATSVSGKNIPENVVDTFRSVAMQQRGAPEEAMRQIRQKRSGAEIERAVEEAGDLTHRMTNMMSQEQNESRAGWEYVKPKVENALKSIRRPGTIARELKESAEHLGVPQEELKKQVSDKLRAYADEHSKIKVYNEAQWLAREASVAIGKEDFESAAKHLEQLMSHLNDSETWDDFATQYTLDDSGNPREYQKQAERVENATNNELAADGKIRKNAVPVDGSFVARPYVMSDSNAFNAAIDKAKNDGLEDDKKNGTYGTKSSKWNGAFVHTYSAEEYKDMKMIGLADGGAGLAVKKSGDIVSVFKNPNVEIKDAMSILIPEAIAQGGTRLDCFNGYLPGTYALYGFKPVAKMKFSREYAPDDWNYERDGEPDIVFMVHDGRPMEEIKQGVENLRQMGAAEKKEYRQNTAKKAQQELQVVPEVSSYDDAEAIQDEEVKKAQRLSR